MFCRSLFVILSFFSFGHCVVCLWFVAGCFVGLVLVFCLLFRLFFLFLVAVDLLLAKNILAAKVNEARKLDGEKKRIVKATADALTTANQQLQEACFYGGVLFEGVFFIVDDIVCFCFF
jgi:hypothetical protein